MGKNLGIFFLCFGAFQVYSYLLSLLHVFFSSKSIRTPGLFRKSKSTPPLYYEWLLS